MDETPDAVDMVLYGTVGRYIECFVDGINDATYDSREAIQLAIHAKSTAGHAGDMGYQDGVLTVL